MKVIKKAKSLSSSNFWNNLIVLATTVFTILGLPAFPGQEALDVIQAIDQKQVSLIIVAVFTLGQSLFKIFRTYQVTGTAKDVVNSRNFWTNVVTIVGGVLASVLMGFPEQELMELTEALFTGNLTVIIVAAANFINIIYHSFIKKQKAPQGG